MKGSAELSKSGEQAMSSINDNESMSFSKRDGFVDSIANHYLGVG